MSYALRKQVAATVRRLRMERGLSRGALAKRTGLHRAFLTGIESDARDLTVESMCKIARGLDVTVPQFLLSVSTDGVPRAEGPG